MQLCSRASVKRELVTNEKLEIAFRRSTATTRRSRQ